jgi:putative transposase
LPRASRVDAPGTIHHVWSRGIERGSIFRDDVDRRDLRDRMIGVAPECGATMPAWAFLDNHFHLVVRTGAAPISRLMRRILTGYGLCFNRRHERTGYVFQGRFGSRIVGGDADLMTVIRYVHRNPLDAGIVSSVEQLARYRWSGHGALMGSRGAYAFESVALALSVFDLHPGEARSKLAEWMRQPDASSAEPDPFDDIVRDACRDLALDTRALRAGARGIAMGRARARICQRAVLDLGLTRSEVARRLGISPAAVVYALRR